MVYNIKCKCGNVLQQNFVTKDDMDYLKTKHKILKIERDNIYVKRCVKCWRENKMKKHKAVIKESEEFCLKCGFSPENKIHTDYKKYGVEEE